MISNTLRAARVAIWSVPLWCLACVAHDPNWREEPHHVSILAAGTFEDDEQAGSVGIDYELRVSGLVGVGVVAERAFGAIETTTLLGVADLHVTDHVIFQTGPGVDFVDGETEFVYRFGGLYEWEVGPLTISPQLHYDWTSGRNAIVAGVAFGVAF